MTAEALPRHEKRLKLYASTITTLPGSGFLLRDTDWQAGRRPIAHINVTRRGMLIYGHESLNRFFSGCDSWLLYIGAAFFGASEP